MSSDEPRRILRSVQLCPNDSAEVADRNLKTSRNSTLCRTTDVDGRPTKDKSNGRVDSCCTEEHAYVGYTWFIEDGGLGLVLVDVGVCEEDYVADCSCACSSNDEGGADVAFLGDDGDADGQDRGENVWRHSEELGCCCGVAEVLDDGGLG